MESRFEIEARRYVEKLHRTFVISQIADERLFETVTDLLLAQANQNERGVNIYTLRLRSILRDCRRKTALRSPISVKRADC